MIIKIGYKCSEKVCLKINGLDKVEDFHDRKIKVKFENQTGSKEAILPVNL